MDEIKLNLSESVVDSIESYIRKKVAASKDVLINAARQEIREFSKNINIQVGDIKADFDDLKKQTEEASVIGLRNLYQDLHI